jgi:hypothetical protein
MDVDSAARTHNYLQVDVTRDGGDETERGNDHRNELTLAPQVGLLRKRMRRIKLRTLVQKGNARTDGLLGLRQISLHRRPQNTPVARWREGRRGVHQKTCKVKGRRLHGRTALEDRDV